MIQKGNRQQGTPFYIGNKNSQKLKRIPLNEKLFQEDWLQDLIHNNPQVLPIDNIESGFAPLIPLCREISTDVGYIDNLFISPNGYLTIVETKLWRNPEAKREVVGQIIDYAKELTTWSYSKLNNSVKQRSKESNGIIDLIKKQEVVDESQEQVIIDNIERNLKRGRILLLIVGDGIRESVEDMVDFLSTSAQLQFTLGLVELQVYSNPMTEKDLIVIPNLITRTREITRAIIKIENNSSDNIVSVETDFDENKNILRSRTSITEEDFLDQLRQNTNNENVLLAKRILDDSKERGFYIDWKQGSFSIKHIDPSGSGVYITLFVVDRNGKIYLMQSSEQLKRIGITKEIAIEYAKNTAALIHGITQNQKNLDTWNKYSELKAVKPNYEKFMIQVESFVKNIDEEIKKIS